MLGIEFCCNSREYYLLCNTKVLTPTDIVFPVSIVDVMAPGGIYRGVLRVQQSSKEPGKRLIVQPSIVDEGSLPYVLIEVGATKSIDVFRNIVAKCVEMEML